ncbi:hypothetical protein LXL04_019439 [Taraxacum kok-saghyz]
MLVPPTVAIPQVKLHPLEWNIGYIYFKEQIEGNVLTYYLISGFFVTQNHIIRNENHHRPPYPWRESRNSLLRKNAKMGINKQYLSFAVDEHDGNCPSIKTSIEIVEHSAGHWHRELQLVHGGEIECENRDDVASLNTKSGEGGGDLKAAAVGLCPCEGVAIDGGSSLEEEVGSNENKLLKRERENKRGVLINSVRVLLVFHFIYYYILIIKHTPIGPPPAPTKPPPDHRRTTAGERSDNADSCPDHRRFGFDPFPGLYRSEIRMYASRFADRKSSGTNHSFQIGMQKLRITVYRSEIGMYASRFADRKSLVSRSKCRNYKSQFADRNSQMTHHNSQIGSQDVHITILRSGMISRPVVCVAFVLDFDRFVWWFAVSVANQILVNDSFTRFPFCIQTNLKTSLLRITSVHINRIIHGSEPHQFIWFEFIRYIRFNIMNIRVVTILCNKSACGTAGV